MDKHKEQLREYYIKTLEFQNELYKRDHVLLKMQQEKEEQQKQLADELDRIKRSDFEKDQLNKNYKEQLKEKEEQQKQLAEELNRIKRSNFEKDQLNNDLIEQLDRSKREVKEITNQIKILEQKLTLTNEALSQKDKLLNEYWERIQSMRIKSRVKRILGLKNK